MEFKTTDYETAFELLVGLLSPDRDVHEAGRHTHDLQALLKLMPDRPLSIRHMKALEHLVAIPKTGYRSAALYVFHHIRSAETRERKRQFYAESGRLAI